MSTKSQSKRFKWSLDSVKGNRVATDALPAPPAYSITGPTANTDVSRKTDVGHLISKKSWELALGPLKQLPMNLFILYMAGNSISIFPIMMVGMFMMRPIQAIWSIKSTFKMIENSNAIGQMAVYILGNFVNIGLALYKCQSMGLLPTHSSDWLAFVDPPIQQEFVSGGIALG